MQPDSATKNPLNQHTHNNLHNTHENEEEENTQYITNNTTSNTQKSTFNTTTTTSTNNTHNKNEHQKHYEIAALQNNKTKQKRGFFSCCYSNKTVNEQSQQPHTQTLQKQHSQQATNQNGYAVRSAKNGARNETFVDRRHLL